MNEKTEKSFHTEMHILVQRFFEETGIRVNSVCFDWHPPREIGGREYVTVNIQSSSVSISG